jgi:hypothetical protein
MQLIVELDGVAALYEARSKGELVTYRVALEQLADSALQHAHGTQWHHVEEVMASHLHDALQWRMFSLLRTIIHVRTQRGLEANPLLPTGVTVLHHIHCPLDVAAIILRKEPHAALSLDKDGRTPLHSHVCRKDHEVLPMVLLLARSENINAKDRHGNTALFYASQYHTADSSMMKSLKDAGAMLAMRDANRSKVISRRRASFPQRMLRKILRAARRNIARAVS